MAEQILDWDEWLDEKAEHAAQRLFNWMQARLHLSLLFQYFLLSLVTGFVLPNPEMDQSEMLTGWHFNMLSAVLFDFMIDVGTTLLGGDNPGLDTAGLSSTNTS